MSRRSSDIAAQSDRLHIIFEDAHVLVIDKPPGLLTATVPHEPRLTALQLVRDHVSRRDPRARVGLIHRLDRDAGGLLVFSKNNDAFESLKDQFYRHTVDRIYHALVEGVPAPAKGRIESSLVELPDGSVRTSRRTNAGQIAITEYQTLRQTPDGSRSLVRVKLQTGRKHQIRVHLSERGWPIVNDSVYNRRKRNGPLMLAATELGFDHPVNGKRVRFEAALPRAMKLLLKA